ncbi:MAG TPA: IPT/TIG domain-containing protein [Terriglobales bacterium]|nr:IPT/TIG domain-containing protein [Terriglobales bacterium]
MGHPSLTIATVNINLELLLRAGELSLFRIGKLLLISGLLALGGFQKSASPPAIDAISPIFGPEGTRVAITGRNLGATTAVSFGKVAATFKVCSEGKVIAIVPRWASTSPIFVSTGEGRAASSSMFGVQNDPRVPEDVGWKAGYVNPVPAPPEFKSVLLWGIAIADVRDPDHRFATVEVARLRLTCRVDGEFHLLNDDQSDLRGGLYRRHPWFGTDEHSPMPFEKNLADRTVRLRIGTRPDRVWHFWSASPRPALPLGKLEGCTVTAQVKISKGALVQMGMDYWRSTTALWAGPDVNNHEAGASNWYFPSDRWQEITFTDIGGPQF